jgi:SAM-dependent methyltransferase
VRLLRRVLLGKRVSISPDAARGARVFAARFEACIVVGMTGSGRVAAPATAPAAPGLAAADRLDIEVETAYRWASHSIADRTVLDVGCGSGHGAALLAQHAKSVVGVGWNPEDVESASRRFGERIRFVIGTPAALNVASGSFEALTCFGPLDRATDYEPIVAELRRALTNDGLLIASLPIGEGRNADAVPGVASSDAGTMVRRPDTTRPSRCQWQSILEARFRNVRLQDRRVCIAVSIAGDSSSDPTEAAIDDAVRLPSEPEACRAVLALASDSELSDPPTVAMLTGLTELNLILEKLRMWEERARRAEAEGSAKHWELVAAREAQRRLRKRLHQLEHRPLRVLSRVIRGKPARLGPGPALRASELPKDWI